MPTPPQRYSKYPNARPAAKYPCRECKGQSIPCKTCIKGYKKSSGKPRNRRYTKSLCHCPPEKLICLKNLTYLTSELDKLNHICRDRYSHYDDWLFTISVEHTLYPEYSPFYLCICPVCLTFWLYGTMKETGGVEMIRVAWPTTKGCGYQIQLNPVPEFPLLKSSLETSILQVLLTPVIKLIYSEPSRYLKTQKDFIPGVPTC